MELYAGLFLVAIGISYLTVRIIQSRSTSRIVKHATKSNRPGLKSTLRSKQKDSSGPVSSSARGKSAGKSLNRSALVAGTIQKPWGW